MEDNKLKSRKKTVSKSDIRRPFKDNDNAIVKMICDIYNDSEYVDYMMGEDKSPDEIETLHNTYKNITLYGDKENPLFLANDIGVIFGIVNINGRIKYYDTSYRKKCIIPLDNKFVKRVCLTTEGIYHLLYTYDKSSVSKLFQKFANSIINYMLKYQSETSNKLLTQIKDNNPELYKKSVEELTIGFNQLKILYEQEKRERYRLEELVEEERERGDELDAELITTISINLVQEEKITLYETELVNKNLTIQCLNNDDVNELDTLRKKYMKEVSIYLVSPLYVKKLMSKTDNNNIDDKIAKYEQRIKRTVIITENYSFVNDVGEPLWFKLSLSLKVKTNNNYIHVGNSYIYNKKSFDNLLNTLDDSCIKLLDSKQYIYKISYDDLVNNIRQLIFTDQ